MKGNIQKLAVFVMMAAIATFIAPATASAGDRDHHYMGIIGEYAFSAGGNSVSTPITNWAPTPNNPFNLVDPALVSCGSYHAHGIVTFGHHGKGTIDFISVGTPTTIPPIIPPATSASAWGATYAHVTYTFTYTVKGDGEMTFEADPNSLKQEVLIPLSGAPGTPAGPVFYRDRYSLTGWVSADHKTITLATPAPRIDTITGPPPLLIPLSKVIMHESVVCIRLDE
jgi:hypothetical protein